MDYSLITKDQIQKRFYSLPAKIRDVLNSESSIESLRQICRNHHLDSERILIVEQLVGLIFLGFVSPNELKKEIIENLHLNDKHSSDIVNEINQKTFASIRSEIDKVYLPAQISSGEIWESKPPTEIHEEDIIDLRKIEAEKIEVESPKIISSEPAEKIEPEIKLEEKKEIEKEEISRPFASIPQKSALEAEPVIIHKEADVRPVLGQKRSLGGLFSFLGSPKEEDKPKVQVSLEYQIESKKPLEKKENLPVETPKIIHQEPRVVHYTELRTPLDNANKEIKPLNSKIEPIMPLIPPKPKIEIPIVKEKEIEIKIPLPEIDKGIDYQVKPEKKGFFKWLFNLFVKKEKTIKEIPDIVVEEKKMPVEEMPAPIKDTNKVNKEIKSLVPKIEEIAEPPKKFDYQLRNKFPEIKSAVEPIKEQKSFGAVQGKSPEIKSKEELKEGDGIIDLRTFEKFKK